MHGRERLKLRTSVKRGIKRDKEGDKKVMRVEKRKEATYKTVTDLETRDDNDV